MVSLPLVMIERTRRSAFGVGDRKMPLSEGPVLITPGFMLWQTEHEFLKILIPSAVDRDFWLVSWASATQAASAAITATRYPAGKVRLMLALLFPPGIQDQWEGGEFACQLPRIRRSQLPAPKAGRRFHPCLRVRHRLE